ncbi:MAG: GWxTD domain-containing protein [Cyclobacteriaceae bacterium]
MKGSKIYIAALLFLLVGPFATALDLTKINMAYQYDLNADVRFKYRVVEKADVYTIFYEVRADTAKIWKTNLITQSGYASEVHDSLTNYHIDSLRIWPARVTAQVQFKIENGADLIVFAFEDLGSGYQYLFDVLLDSPLGFPDFHPTDEDGLPVLDSYIISKGLEMNADDERYHAYQYSHEFIGADPAMGQMKPLAPTFNIDSSYFFEAAISNLELDNFYLLQKDSLDRNGITVLKVPGYYPKSKRLDELVGPLQYITTDSEMKSLRSGIDTKRVFEQFWINTYGGKFLAKQAIRSYYRKVEASNILFTDFKRGWKTDRGVLYIVFGKPQEVIKSKRGEIWKYGDDLEFEFIKISTLFAPSFYSLRRDIKYENIWYERVGKIRTQ